MPRYKLRTLLILLAVGVGSFLFGRGVALGIDSIFYSMLHKRPLDIPYIVKLLRGPGELITWMFVLGDSGTEAEWRFWEVTIGTVFYTCIAFTVAMMTFPMVWLAGRFYGRR